MPWLPQIDPDWAAEEVGRWIAEARRLATFSQAALAERAGLSQSTISRVEHGLVPMAALSTIGPLLIVLRTELAEAEMNRQAELRWQVMHRLG